MKSISNIKIYIAIFIIILYTIISYNRMISKEEKVSHQWSNVETAYQKRMDLIDQLIATVKGSAKFEKELLKDVISSRYNNLQPVDHPSKLTGNYINEFQNYQDKMSSTLNRLLLVVEKYPDIKSTENFLNLQTSIESMEAEILHERKKYNDRSKEFNSYIKSIPSIFIAKLFGFKYKGYFMSNNKSQNAPKIEF